MRRAIHGRFYGRFWTFFKLLVIHAVVGPRQVGKTMLVRQVVEEDGRPAHFASADEPTLRQRDWLVQQWETGRSLAAGRKSGAVLVLDEIQKVAGWSETVKHLWDADTARRVPLRVVVLGSAPLLLQSGLTESLAGRFELLRLPHWSFVEMRDAFGFDLDRYLVFGGYPGAAPLAKDARRWATYIKDSLIETTISRDVLLLTRIDKPALLRQVFHLGCQHSGRVLSYTKMLGQLQDAGNTTTLAHYLDLLSGSGLVMGLPKYAGNTVRQRGASPKLQVLNTALMTALEGMTLADAKADGTWWGHLVESAVGAHLANAAQAGVCQLFYWADRGREVDFVLDAPRSLVAIEVKAGTRRPALGIDAFMDAFHPTRVLLVGGDGIPLEDFLSTPVERWVRR